ncbi:MAG: ABC transporter ATP-binding protein [Candidatus Lokiarchaeota archaeon]|nr:ABC transporter ATP-binding protein [Candidatus Harpocratesius repetitus]
MKKLEIINLRLKYQKEYILDGLNLTIHEGEIIVFLGQSGCGKTSLLKILLGILTPDEGTVRLNEQDITFLPPQKRKMGYVPQAQVLFPHMTVKENIMFGLNVNKSLTQPDRRYRQALALTQLTEFENRFPDELSGGQQQRVALARALVIEPQFLLLDEPLSSIDATGREELALMIRLIQQETNTTIIYVTHNHEEAKMLADRIAVLFDGKIQQIGHTPDVYSHPKNYQVAKILGKENIWSIIEILKQNDFVILKTNLGSIIIHEDLLKSNSPTGIELPLNIYSLEPLPDFESNSSSYIENESSTNIDEKKKEFIFICKINAIIDQKSEYKKIILCIWPNYSEIIKIFISNDVELSCSSNLFYRIRIPWSDFVIF